MKARWHFFLAGNIERGPNYRWEPGFARVVVGGVQYPWMTRREAQHYAKSYGARAVFYVTETAARAAMHEEG